MSKLILLEKNQEPILTPDRLPEPYLPLAEAPPSPVHLNPAKVYLKKLKAGGGRRSMESQLKKVALSLGFFNIEVKQTKTKGLQTKYVGDIERFPWQELNYAMVQDLVSSLTEAVDNEELNLRTARLIHNGIRGVIQEAYNLEQISADTLIRIKSIKHISGELDEAGRALTFVELQALIDTCRNENSIRGVRDKAIIAICYGCGLRREELAKLPYKSYKTEIQKIQVTGKGRKQRSIKVPPNACAHLEEWLDLRGRNDGPMWHSITKDNRIKRNEGLSTQSIYDLLGKRAKQAAIASCTPHDLRRTFVTTILEMTDLSTAQYMARHASPVTTVIYDKSKDKKADKTADALPVPL